MEFHLEDIEKLELRILILMMNNIEKIYLELLSVAILRRPLHDDIRVDLQDTLRQKVSALSDKQRTSAVAAESIHPLPEHLLPPRPIRMKIVLQQEQLRKK